MKMLLSVDFPLEPFNSLVRSGKAGEVIGRILETIKPETARSIDLTLKQSLKLIHCNAIFKVINN